MPYITPTIPQLTAESIADLAGRLSDADLTIVNDVLPVLAKVMAGGLDGLYQEIGFVADQIFPQTAEAEFLEQQASLFNLYRKLPSVASGLCAVTGNPGVALPGGTILLASDNTQYVTVADILLGNQATSVPVAARLGGIAGNRIAGAKLYPSNNLAGLAYLTVLDPGIGGGTDQEQDPQLAARLIARRQTPPRGGNNQDYLTWATDVPGVTRAWVLPGWMGAATVGVTCVMDGQAAIIPDPATIAAVQAMIDRMGTTGITKYAFAPTALPVAIQIHAPSLTLDMQAAIGAGLASLFTQEGVPGATIYLSHLQEAAFGSIATFDAQIVAPTGAIAALPYQIPLFAGVSFI